MEHDRHTDHVDFMLGGEQRHVKPSDTCACTIKLSAPLIEVS